MRRLAMAIAALAAPAAAQDFSEGSTANSWNLYAEAPAAFEATVVDPLCVLAGDCPEDCGGGRRQLALLRAADGVMVLPLKNNQPLFTGAATDLQPYCGKAVEVDGLLLDDPDLGAANVFQVQKIRETDATDWATATRWTEVWTAANPDAQGEGPWFRRDPRVGAAIAEHGWLGLGPEAEADFLKDWLPE